MQTSLIKLSVFLCSVFTLYSCSSLFRSEGDISNLPESYFICDSVESTPVQYRLAWLPGPDDSVFIKFLGDPCSKIDYRSGWLRDSIISIAIDTKKSTSLNINMIFGLSSPEDHIIHYTVSIDNSDLSDEKVYLKKKELQSLIELRTKIYLPLFRLDSFVKIEGEKFVCNDSPQQDIMFRPKMVDPAVAEHSYTIMDYFTISVESGNPEVSLYDKYLNRDMGRSVEARINDFGKYKLSLNSPYEDISDDTVTIAFSINDFVNKYEMYVSKDCPPEEKKDMIVIIGDGEPLYPGDTVDVHLSYKDQNGNEFRYSKNAAFEAGLISGCNSAKILDKKGELKSFFDEIREPIRLVITFPFDPDDSHINLVVGYKGDEEVK